MSDTGAKDEEVTEAEVKDSASVKESGSVKDSASVKDTASVKDGEGKDVSEKEKDNAEEKERVKHLFMLLYTVDTGSCFLFKLNTGLCHCINRTCVYVPTH